MSIEQPLRGFEYLGEYLNAIGVRLDKLDPGQQGLLKIINRAYGVSRNKLEQRRLLIITTAACAPHVLEQGQGSARQQNAHWKRLYTMAEREKRMRESSRMQTLLNGGTGGGKYTANVHQFLNTNSKALCWPWVQCIVVDRSRKQLGQEFFTVGAANARDEGSTGKLILPYNADETTIRHEYAHAIANNIIFPYGWIGTGLNEAITEYAANRTIGRAYRPQVDVFHAILKKYPDLQRDIAAGYRWIENQPQLYARLEETFEPLGAIALLLMDPHDPTRTYPQAIKDVLLQPRQIADLLRINARWR